MVLTNVINFETDLFNQESLPKQLLQIWVTIVLGIMTLKGYSIHAWALELEPHHQIQLSVLLMTPYFVVSYHSIGSIVYSKPYRLGESLFSEEIFNWQQGLWKERSSIQVLIFTRRKPVVQLVYLMYAILANGFILTFISLRGWVLILIQPNKYSPIGYQDFTKAHKSLNIFFLFPFFLLHEPDHTWINLFFKYFYKYTQLPMSWISFSTLFSFEIC